MTSPTLSREDQIRVNSSLSASQLAWFGQADSGSLRAGWFHWDADTQRLLILCDVASTSTDPASKAPRFGAISKEQILPGLSGNVTVVSRSKENSAQQLVIAGTAVPLDLQSEEGQQALTSLSSARLNADSVHQGTPAWLDTIAVVAIQPTSVQAADNGSDASDFRITLGRSGAVSSHREPYHLNGRPQKRWRLRWGSRAR